MPVEKDRKRVHLALEAKPKCGQQHDGADRPLRNRHRGARPVLDIATKLEEESDGEDGDERRHGLVISNERSSRCETHNRQRLRHHYIVASPSDGTLRRGPTEPRRYGPRRVRARPASTESCERASPLRTTRSSHMSEAVMCDSLRIEAR